MVINILVRINNKKTNYNKMSIKCKVCDINSGSKYCINFSCAYCCEHIKCSKHGRENIKKLKQKLNGDYSAANDDILYKKRMQKTLNIIDLHIQKMKMLNQQLFDQTFPKN